MPEEAPKILIASKSQPIEEIKATAAATKVDPNKLVEEKPAEKPKEEPSSQASRVGGIVEAGLVAGGLEAVQESARAFGEKAGEQVGAAIADKLSSRKGGGVEEEPQVSRERPGLRPFNEIQKELRDLIDNPDKEKETQLRIERQRLINAAKETGVFDVIKRQIDDAQRTNDYTRAREMVLGINVQRKEEEAKGLQDWDDRFSGMLDEYRDVAIANMSRAMLNALGEDNSPETKRLDREIEIRGWGAPPQGLEGMARKYLESGQEQGSEKDAGLRDLSERINKGQQEIFRQFAEMQKITLEQFMELSERQATELSEAFRGVSPGKERERWADVEYQQDFYARFQPNQEPRFYTALPKEERDIFDARWQLARAASVKKAMAAFPDKYAENQDLLLLSKDKMETLYRMPGVKRMMETYADVIAGNTVVRGVGSIWDCKDQDDFEKFRTGLREKVFQGETMSPLAAKEADAVAWNLMWVGNLVESVDSRYSYSGGRHGDLPGVIVADEFRWTLHVQEKAETKWSSHHNTWGAFGKWGVAQIYAIEKRLDMKDSGKDEILFTPAASPRNYWSFRVRGDLQPKKEEHKGGRVIEIFTPECYPVTSARSFWEETKAKGVPLLDYLLKGEEIPWGEVKADAWGIYVIGKFNKAVKLAEYFNPGKPMEKQKPGWAKEWADPILELFVRLDPKKELEKLYEKKDKKGKTIQPKRTFQTFHNLKAWAVYASHGGVRNPEERSPTLNISFGDKIVLEGALSDNRIRYLSQGENLTIN